MVKLPQCDYFFSTSLIFLQRTSQEVQACYNKMKTENRGAKTRERQSRLLTGGGPQEPPAELNPMIEAMEPALRKKAPTPFSSNYSADVIQSIFFVK